MAKPDEEKSDGLEIVSIGTLYSGPWDKKYWSSSRGKDRYPYPVGYKAVRTQNRIAYMMEIHEGLKGPLFSIACIDGQPCSGQTPDIAWENFQKKGCPHIKLWHGKRFSCNIDGVEFFGFKNPFVQRLLRELVANVGGIAERSLLSSTSLNGDLETEHHSQCKESGNNPDLLSCFARPQIKGKRNRKEKTLNSNLVSGACLKKLRPKDEMHKIDTTGPRQGTQSYLNGGTSMTCCAVNQENDIYINPRALAASISLETAVERENNLFGDGLLLEEEVPPLKESSLVGYKNLVSTGTFSNLSMHDQPLDRSEDAEIQMLGSSFLSEDKDGEAPVTKDTENVNDMDLCAPDSLDIQQESSSDAQPSSLKETSLNGKNELVSGNVVISEGLEPELHPLEEIVTLNASSEKSDVDSVGQEITNSMMTVLLPRALPLLKTFSRKNKTTRNSSEISPCREQHQKENNGTGHHEDIASLEVHTQSCPLDQPQKEKMHILNTDSGSVVPILCQNGSGVPDSIKNDQSGSDVAEPGLAAICESRSKSDTSEVAAGVDASNQSSICHVGADSKYVCSYSKGPVISIGRPNNGDILISESASGCMPSNENVFLTCNKDMCRRQDDKLESFEIHSKEKNLTNSLNCSKGKSHAQVDEELPRHPNIVDASNSVSWLQKQGMSFSVNNSEVARGSSLKPQMNIGHNDKPERIVESVGCYVHPLPVSMVLLNSNTKENEIYICVLCGVLADKRRTLFMYKISLKEQRLGCPSSIGHTPMLLPISRDAFGREIALDRSGLQFTPDGQHLVLLTSMKTPYCREGKMQCPCSACMDCFDNNAVKVVLVKRGYVSVVVNLKTVDNVHCILVCEPNYLVCVEESGRLHLWVMNSTWSAQMEECDLSTSDCIFPCIVDLKRIPNCAALVVGHNGFGEFGLWDISKRTFVARFSYPSTSVFQFLPISLFRWQSNDQEDHINNIMAATKISFLEQVEKHVSIPRDGEDFAVWLFISTVCNSDVQHGFQSSTHKINQVGLWRLALLVENRVILGSTLDPRAAAVGASAGHGIIGTGDGFVYLWELSTGAKLRHLRCFKGLGISCIAVGDSTLGPLAVAGGDQLKVYLHSQGGLL